MSHSQQMQVTSLHTTRHQDICSELSALPQGDKI